MTGATMPLGERASSAARNSSRTHRRFASMFSAAVSSGLGLNTEPMSPNPPVIATARR
jgi:hypothetical protein